GNDITRRVGALEVTVPQMLEAMPPYSLVDMASQTASIGANETLTFNAQGGSVAVRQSALPQAQPAQPLPAPVTPPDITPVETALAVPNSNAYGIAIGASVPFEQAPSLWEDLTVKLGPLLFGLAPLLTEEANGDGKRIVVGPITELSEARSLCERFERVSIACVPMPYDGTPLSVTR